MRLTSERGRKIRLEYSEVKEKQVCEEKGLIQIGGSKTKIDGAGDGKNASIKNFHGKSTQVHLTTQNHFCKILELDENCIKFIKMFCGSESLNNKGTDRFTIQEIDANYVNSFMDFLNKNKLKVVDLIVRNGFDVNYVVCKNLKTNQLYEISYEQIINKIKDCEWVAKKGGIHLKNKDKKTYFHFQREGKRNKNNRYNVLWHIHLNLFLSN
jgi:hypothetical protein